MIIYIHGFNSSAASYKATVLRERMAGLGMAEQVQTPTLSDVPERAIAILETLLAQHQGQNTTLIGSSLGGYYATWLAEKYDLKAVLVNPAVRPYELLAAYLGPNRNWHTGEEYVLTEEHIQQLQALEVPVLHHLESYLVLLESGDDVLDYRQAVARYRGADVRVIEGGDHSYSHFEEQLDMILQFAGIVMER